MKQLNESQGGARIGEGYKSGLKRPAGNRAFFLASEVAEFLRVYCA
jgi:hypothetical protein